MQKQEIELTRDFLVESCIGEKALKDFDKRFQNGLATVSKILKFCEELNLYSLAQSLLRKLPKNPSPLILEEYSGGNLFYNGDIHVKKGFECSDKIICQKLFVDGDLVLGENAEIYGDVDVKTLDMSEFAEIHGDVDVKTLNMDEYAEIHGDVDAKTLNMNEYARIHGDVDTKTLNMSEDAEIHGDVDTKTLNMGGNADIHGDVDTKTLNMGGNSEIYGDVDTKTLNMGGN